MGLANLVIMKYWMHVVATKSFLLNKTELISLQKVVHNSERNKNQIYMAISSYTMVTTLRQM